MRDLKIIASEIRQDWVRPSAAAAPYLSAMGQLGSPSERYYEDSGRSIVAYFLANASGWKGEKARAVKTELKSMLLLK